MSDSYIVDIWLVVGAGSDDEDLAMQYVLAQQSIWIAMMSTPGPPYLRILTAWREAEVQIWQDSVQIRLTKQSPWPGVVMRIC